MLKISLDVERRNHRYDILLEPGLCRNWREEVQNHINAASYLVLVDSTLARIMKLPPSGAIEGKWRFLRVEAGEPNKTFAQYRSLMERALTMDLDRHSVVVAIGGGVTGDISGFIAATLFRGVRIVMIPTSLLAQVDSSVGGKNGINTPGGKNLVGSIHQPELVLIDPAFLDTLPRREFLAGLAEIVKVAILDGRDFFFRLQRSAGLLLARDHGFLAGSIAQSCRIKAAIVTEDELEKGRRALLNLGHTFGHALEALAGYDGRVVHGEAVAVGLALACRFAAARSGMPAGEAEEVEALLAELGLPTAIAQLGVSGSEPIDWRRALADGAAAGILASDKKAAASGVVLVLPRAVGDCRLEKGFAAEEVIRFMLARVDGGR